MEEAGKGDCPKKFTVNQEVCGTVAVMLANPNCQTVVVDRQPGQPPFVMAFSVNWNEVRARVEQCESLTRVLVAGGPVERKEG